MVQQTVGGKLYQTLATTGDDFLGILRRDDSGRKPVGCLALIRQTSSRFNRALDPYELITKVANWSQRDDRVVAAGLCGSYARGEARPDSDIDFCLLSPDPELLLDDRSWIHSFGPDARVAGSVENYNLVQSIRVFYGTTEAEFGVTDEAWIQLPLDEETAGVINNGLQVLYDPEGRLAQAAARAAKMLR